MRTSKLAFLALALSLVALTSCGTGRTFVLEAPRSEYRVDGYRLEHEGSTASVPPEIVARFESAVRKRTERAKFASGDALLLRYRFIQFDEGSQFERWFWGGIGNAGEGSLTAEVTFLDAGGAALAKIQAEGRINSGFFGGTLEDALDKLAAEVADYALKQFARPAEQPPKG